MKPFGRSPNGQAPISPIYAGKTPQATVRMETVARAWLKSRASGYWPRPACVSQVTAWWSIQRANAQKQIAVWYLNCSPLTCQSGQLAQTPKPIFGNKQRSPDCRPPDLMQGVPARKRTSLSTASSTMHPILRLRSTLMRAYRVICANGPVATFK